MPYMNELQCSYCVVTVKINISLLEENEVFLTTVSALTKVLQRNAC